MATPALTPLLSNPIPIPILHPHGHGGGEAEAGVRQGGPAQARHGRPHARRQGAQLQDRPPEGPPRRCRRRPGGAANQDRRVPHRRRDRLHPLHRPQRAGYGTPLLMQ